jgi:hypothetical protein
VAAGQPRLEPVPAGHLVQGFGAALVGDGTGASGIVLRFEIIFINLNLVLIYKKDPNRFLDLTLEQVCSSKS